MQCVVERTRPQRCREQEDGPAGGPLDLPEYSAKFSVVSFSYDATHSITITRSIHKKSKSNKRKGNGADELATIARPIQ